MEMVKNSGYRDSTAVEPKRNMNILDTVPVLHMNYVCFILINPVFKVSHLL